MRLGPFAFLLQAFDAEGFAANFMTHLLVKDLDAWWKRIEIPGSRCPVWCESSECAGTPALGVIVAYVFDSSGVLWHFAKERAENG